MRYLFVAAGWLWPWLAAPLTPTLRGRTICIVQIVGLSLAVSPLVAPPVSNAVAGVALALLAYSFLADIERLRQQRG
jgi:hypothetical protein